MFHLIICLFGSPVWCAAPGTFFNQQKLDVQMWNADENMEHEGTCKVCVCNISEQSLIVPEMSQTALAMCCRNCCFFLPLQS